MKYVIANQKLLFLVLFLLVSVTATAADFVAFSASKDDFAISKDNQPASMLIDPSERKGLKLAVKNLQSDLNKVTGETPSIVHTLPKASSLIVVGTLENSTAIKALQKAGKINLQAIQGQWEAYQIQLVSQPFEGVDQALVITGSDMRGAIFGVYELSSAIGVSPWYWWADVPVAEHQDIFVKADTLVVDWPKVKYRGIFLNDEAPALTGWVQENFGNYNSEFYGHVFELMLRLKANYLWPAMWNNAFNLDDPKNPELAHEMGIVMGTSHHEPMMRADKEWNWTGEGKWDYAVNEKHLYEFWQQGAKRHKQLDSIFTLGMRGQEDEPMSEEQNIALLEKIVSDQRSILKEVYQRDDISDVPQVWTLYKEVQGYYENGMRVPDDVTLLWSDDNWGNIRRLPTAKERERSGGAGVYYHFDYVGGPRSYRWMNTVPIAKIWEQMNLAYQYNAREIWITNVGDLKPMELPTDFFLKMAWDPTQFSAESLSDYLVSWAQQQFWQQYAQQIADLVQGYTRHNGRRKPELLAPDTYSQLAYNEAQRISDELINLSNTAEEIAKKLGERYQDAFFQLVLHPIQASRNVYELNNSLAKNYLYAGQQRVTTNQYAEQAREWFAADAALEKRYHSINNGKWNHFMSQPHIGYTHWNNPRENTMPVVHVNQPISVADMGVAVEGSAKAWPQTGGMQLEFSSFGQQEYYFDVFNRGTQTFNFEATPSNNWIKLSTAAGEIDKQKRIQVTVDWAQLKEGDHKGYITVKGANLGQTKIAVTAFKAKQETRTGFIEADGYVSIEAANTKIGNNSPHAFWQEIPLHGRTLSSMSVTMPANTSFADNILEAPYLEYDVFLFSSGELQLDLFISTQPEFCRWTRIKIRRFP